MIENDLLALESFARMNISANNNLALANKPEYDLENQIDTTDSEHRNEEDLKKPEFEHVIDNGANTLVIGNYIFKLHLTNIKTAIFQKQF